MDPGFSGEEEGTEIAFHPKVQPDGYFTTYTAAVAGFSRLIRGDTVWGCAGHGPEVEQ